MARGRVPVDDEALERKREAAYTSAVESDTRRRIICEKSGHNTYLFSKFCTRCGWILTDDEARRLE